MWLSFCVKGAGHFMVPDDQIKMFDMQVGEEGNKLTLYLGDGLTVDVNDVSDWVWEALEKALKATKVEKK